MKGSRPNKALFDLAIWFSGAMCGEGERLSCKAIAANVNAVFEVLMEKPYKVSAQAIDSIEKKALRKLRHPALIKRLR